MVNKSKESSFPCLDMGHQGLGWGLVAGPQGWKRSPPEFLKVLDVVELSWLTHLCNITWTLGTVLLDWKSGVAVLLIKKRDQRVCSNYHTWSHSSASLVTSIRGSWWVGSVGSRRSSVIFVLVVLVSAKGFTMSREMDPLTRAVQSLHERCQTLICIADSKLDPFLVRVWLYQGCPLPLILLS